MNEFNPDKRYTIRNSDGSVSQPTDLDWYGALYKLAEYEDLGIDLSYLKEIAEASKEGRLKIQPKSLDITCESCKHFCPDEGKASGCCDIRVDKYFRRPLWVSRSKKACKSSYSKR